MKNLPEKKEKPDKSALMPYFTAAAGVYHLLPLVIVIAMGDGAFAPLSWVLLLILPIFNVAAGFLSGVRLGFTIRIPLLFAIIFAPSIIMYYNKVTTPEELMTALASTVVNTAVCFLFTLAACAAGGFVKRFIKGV